RPSPRTRRRPASATAGERLTPAPLRSGRGGAPSSAGAGGAAPSSLGLPAIAASIVSSGEPSARRFHQQVRAGDSIVRPVPPSFAIRASRTPGSGARPLPWGEGTINSQRDRPTSTVRKKDPADLRPIVVSPEPALDGRVSAKLAISLRRRSAYGC